MTREERIDKLMEQVEGEMTDLDAMLMIFVNGISNDVSTCVVASICNIFDNSETEQRASDMMDLFLSTIITYAMHHPKFGTKFIQMYNKIVYGVDL